MAKAKAKTAAKPKVNVVDLLENDIKNLIESEERTEQAQKDVSTLIVPVQKAQTSEIMERLVKHVPTAPRAVPQQQPEDAHLGERSWPTQTAEDAARQEAWAGGYSGYYG